MANKLPSIVMWIADGGHEWLRVPRPLYESSGYKASRYSYDGEGNGYVYLEGDCDAAGFVAALDVSPEEVRSLQSVYLSAYDRHNPRKLPYMSGVGFVSPFAS